MSVPVTEMTLLQRFGQLNIRNESSKNGFPLLKLPQLVLLECIENLDVLEILIFSLLSKRAKSTAKLIRWNPLDICLKFEDDTHICLKFPNDPSREWAVDYDKESSYPYLQSTLNGPNVSRHLVLKDNGNAIGEIKLMIEHICEVFRSPICGIDIIEESLIEWVINLQSTIQYVWINDDVVTSVEILNRILKNLNVTEYFRLGSIKTDQKFEFTEPIPSRLVTIYNSYWFTLPAILNGNYSVIRLFGSKLTPMDINTILKEWQRGYKLRNLSFLEINTSTLLDIDSCAREILKDVNIALGGYNGRPRTVKVSDDYTYTVPFEPFVDNIIRRDGMIGTIFKTYKSYKYEKLKFIRFRFQVWRQT